MTEAIYMGSISGAVAAIFDRLWNWRYYRAVRKHYEESLRGGRR